ncbi:MAG: glycosyltransferase family 39 protein [Acidobacteria bacterium]|nr:glycosyltransferase family 39 protein [Acidobacteriota bacterium]
MAGLVFRVVGFSSSLWLDEFGTLWAVEGGAVNQVLERALAFHPQSPFYYLLTWMSVRLLGESEMALRLPALVFGVALVLIVYRLGQEAGGKTIGLFAAALAWVSYPLVEASASARPYTLAAFMAAVMLYGFLRAARTGNWTGRLLFIAGGAGLFYAHYACAVEAVGIAVAYALIKEIREHYSPFRFVGDVCVQAVLVLPCLPHLRNLWARRGALSWLEAPDYLAVFEVVAPLLVLALAGAMWKKEPRLTLERPVESWLWIVLATPAVALTAMAVMGSNLLEARYLLAMTAPAVVLAAWAVLRMPRRLLILPMGYLFLWSFFFFGAHFILEDSFSGAGRQDWRGAVARLDKILSKEGRAPVLYRSGFVEEDGWPGGRVSPVTFAPLRSPGRRAPVWNLLSLTYRWRVPMRDEYFERLVTPAIAQAPVFYVMSCDNGPEDYSVRFREWVAARFPGRFDGRRLKAGQGITLLRFEARAHVESTGTRATAPERLESSLAR